jgi:long-chain acyl-CoA synthetase
VLHDILSIAAGLEARGLKARRCAHRRRRQPRLDLFFDDRRQCAGRFPVAGVPDVPVDQFDSYMRFGDPKVALAEDQEQVDKLLELRARTGRPQTIVYDDRAAWQPMATRGSSSR